MKFRLHPPTWPEAALIAAIACLLTAAAVLFALDYDGEPESQPVGAGTLPAASFNDGRYEVLVAVKSGIYRTQGSTVASFPLCSWKMFKAGRLVASGTSTGPTSIVVEPMYDEVDSRGCQTWRRQR